MLLSFIVIGRNEGSKLDRCFKSIVNFCDTNNFNNEIIYVDSQSIDNTEDVLHNWGNIKFLVLDGLCNAARARNLGANCAKGDVFCFPNGLIHQEIALTNCEIIEASTPHFNDRVRVESRYNIKSSKGLPTTKKKNIRLL